MKVKTLSLWICFNDNPKYSSIKAFFMTRIANYKVISVGKSIIIYNIIYKTNCIITLNTGRFKWYLPTFNIHIKL